MCVKRGSCSRPAVVRKAERSGSAGHSSSWASGKQPLRTHGQVQRGVASRVAGHAGPGTPGQWARGQGVISHGRQPFHAPETELTRPDPSSLQTGGTFCPTKSSPPTEVPRLTLAARCAGCERNGTGP